MQLAKAMALELAPPGVTVNLIAPGTIETDLNRAFLADAENRQAKLGLIPMERIGRPEDVAGAAVFLASDAAALRDRRDDRRRRRADARMSGLSPTWKHPAHQVEWVRPARRRGALRGGNMDRETRLVHAGRDPERQEGIVNPPLYRASTILYPTMAAYEGRFERRYTSFAYGIHGTPTTIALAEAVAELSGGARTLLLSSGLSAVTQALTAFLRRDDHLLIADTVYQPDTGLLQRRPRTLRRGGHLLRPRVGAGIADLIRPSTRVVYLESPGSQTFEVQDVPAIAAAAARARRRRDPGQHLGDAAQLPARSSTASTSRSRR